MSDVSESVGGGSECSGLRKESEKILRWQKETNQQAENLERELQYLEGLFESNKLKISSRRKVNEQLSVKFSSKEEESVKLESKYEEVKHQVATVESQLTKLNSEIKIFANVKETISTQLKEKHDFVEEMQGAVGRLKMKTENKLKEGLQVLENTTAEKESGVSKLQQDQINLRSDLDAGAIRMEQLNKQYVQLQQDDHDTHSSYETRLKEKEVHENEIDAKKKEESLAKNDHSVKIDMMNNKIISAQATLQKMEIDFGGKQESLKILNQQKYNASEELQLSSDKHKIVSTEYESVKSTNSKLTDQLEVLQNKLQDSKFEKDCLIQSTKGQGKLALDVRMIVEDLKQAISNNKVLEVELEAREGIDKNIENLNAKKDDLESTLENKKEEMRNKLNAHDVQLKKMKESVKGGSCAHECEKNSLQESIDGLMNTFRDLNTAKQTAKLLLKEARDAARCKSQSLTELKSKLDIASIAVEEKSKKLETLSKEAERSMADHETETSAYEDEMTQLAERLNRLQHEKENALAKIKTTTDEMSQARVGLDLAAQDEVKLQISVDQIKTLSADIQAKYQKLDQLTEQESSAKLKIVTLVSGEQDEQASIDHLEEELNSWLSRLATFSYQEKDHQALVKEAELIKRELGSQERKRKELELEAEEVELQSADIERQIEDVQAKIQATKQQTQQDVEKIDARFKEESQQKRQEISALHKDNSKAERKVTNLRIQLERMKTDEEKLSQQIKHLESTAKAKEEAKKALFQTPELKENPVDLMITPARTPRYTETPAKRTTGRQSASRKIMSPGGPGPASLGCQPMVSPAQPGFSRRTIGSSKQSAKKKAKSASKSAKKQSVFSSSDSDSSPERRKDLGSRSSEEKRAITSGGEVLEETPSSTDNQQPQLMKTPTSNGKPIGFRPKRLLSTGRRVAFSDNQELGSADNAVPAKPVKAGSNFPVKYGSAGSTASSKLDSGILKHPTNLSNNNSTSKKVSGETDFMARYGGASRYGNTAGYGGSAAFGGSTTVGGLDTGISSTPRTQTSPRAFGSRMTPRNKLLMRDNKQKMATKKSKNTNDVYDMFNDSSDSDL